MASEPDRLLRELRNRVLTLRMNHPRRLNGWTIDMQHSLKRVLADAGTDDGVGALVLTGTGPYYSAGVDFGGAMRPMHPAALHAAIERANYELFDAFIQFPKPIIAAVNGHAIGAPVTTATLCDHIIASEAASFRTPFARFGLPAEGCSSVVFPKLLGAATAQRILGEEGWCPTAREALQIGLVDEVVPDHQLLDRAQARAETWLAQGYTRSYKAGASKLELTTINARESTEVADAILSGPFLMSQSRFLASKKKTGLALAFLGLRLTRPLWALFLARSSAPGP